jgi:TadE-like protein
MQAIRSLWHDRRGSALVEGAIVIPVLMALLFGVYEFSWFFYQQHLITIGLRDAARYLARTADACVEEAVTQRNLQEANARNLATTGSIGGGAARVSGWGAGMIAIQCTPINNPISADGLKTYRGGDVIYVVTVSTRFAERSLGFFGLLGLQPPIIAASHSERVIGPG